MMLESVLLSRRCNVQEVGATKPVLAFNATHSMNPAPWSWSLLARRSICSGRGHFGFFLFQLAASRIATW